MSVLVAVVNLAALGTGAAAAALAYRLDRDYRLPPLRDYLFFVVMMVVSGFFDWVVFNLVVLFAPGLSAEQADSIYHIFWNLIGFPCAMAAAGGLLFAVLGLLGYRLDRRRRRFLSLPFAALALLSVIEVVPLIGGLEPALGKALWFGFIFVLPAFIVFVLAAAVVLARRIPDPAEASFVRSFALALLAGYAVWTGLSLFPTKWHPSNHVSILWFFMMLLPPTLILRRRSSRLQRLETIGDLSREALAPVFDSFEFTEREKDVALLLLKGKSYRTMARELFVSLQTVKNHVSRIYKKTGARNRVELVNLVRNAAWRGGPPA